MTRVRFRVLGSLEVEVDGVAAALGGTRQRTVLAVLLLHANEPVATDRLVSESWGENAPASATKTAQVYVSRLRGTLGNDTLTATPGGYLLGVAPGALDTDELEELRARAREADPREAGRLLREGLALWRGPPYADLRYEEALQPEIRRLEELRLATLEERIEADLAAGEASQLVAELEALVAEHPHRERLRGLLMLALYRSGRQTEALETYQQGRQLLDSELGLEPGPELKELERAILAHDPALDGPQRAIRRTGAATLRRTGGRRRGAAARRRPDCRLRCSGPRWRDHSSRRGRRGARLEDGQAPGDGSSRQFSLERRGRGGSGLGARRGRQDDLGHRSEDAVARDLQQLVHPDRPRRGCRGALDRERVSRASVLGYELPGERLAPRPGDPRRC